MNTSFARSATGVLAKLLLSRPFSAADLAHLGPEELVATARWHHVLLASYRRLSSLPDVPRELLDLPGLKEETLRRRAFRSLLQKELLQATTALSEAGVTVLALKGTASLVENAFLDPDRELSDLDLLVHVGKLHRALAVLKSIGYEEGRQEAEHHTTLERRVGQVRAVIELHTGLLSPQVAGGSASVLLWMSRRFWSQSRAAGPGPWTVRLLAVHHALIHTALHLALHHYPPRLKWLMDLSAYAARLSEDDWTPVISEVEGTPAEGPLAYALLLLELCSPSSISSSVAEWAGRHPRAALCADMALSLLSRKDIQALSVEQERALHLLHLQVLGASSPQGLPSSAGFPRQAVALTASVPHEDLAQVSHWLTWADLRGAQWARSAMLIEKGPDLLSDSGTMGDLLRALAESGPWPWVEKLIWRAIDQSDGSRRALMTKLYCLCGLGASLREVGPLILPDLFPPVQSLLGRLLLPAYALRNLMAVPLSFWLLLACLSFRRLVGGRDG